MSLKVKKVVLNNLNLRILEYYGAKRSYFEKSSTNRILETSWDRKCDWWRLVPFSVYYHPQFFHAKFGTLCMIMCSIMQS